MHFPCLILAVAIKHKITHLNSVTKILDNWPPKCRNSIHVELYHVSLVFTNRVSPLPT